ncbi:MAG: aldo/keto reductase [Nitrososphaeria archaeon]
MAAQVLSGISIKRDKLETNPLGVKLAFETFLNSGLNVLDLRDSWIKMEKFETFLKPLRENKNIIILARFYGIYPNYENILHQISMFKNILGRPPDVFEVKMPNFFVSLKEILKGFRKALDDGMINGFGVIGWKPSYIKEIYQEDLVEKFHHIKIDFNALTKNKLYIVKKLQSLKVNVFSSSPLGGGILTDKGYMSLKNRIIHGHVLNKLKKISENKGFSISQIALSWLNFFKVSYAPSTSEPLHVKEILRSLEIKLNENELLML